MEPLGCPQGSVLGKKNLLSSILPWTPVGPCQTHTALIFSPPNHNSGLSFIIKRLCSCLVLSPIYISSPGALDESLPSSLTMFDKCRCQTQDRRHRTCAITPGAPEKGLWLILIDECHHCPAQLQFYTSVVATSITANSHLMGCNRGGS